MKEMQLVVRNKALWSFALKVDVIYSALYHMYSDGLTYRESLKMTTSEHPIVKDVGLGCNDWTLESISDRGVEAYVTSSHGFDLTGLHFTIARLSTKAGVVLKNGEDIMECLKGLAEEVEPGDWDEYVKGD